MHYQNLEKLKHLRLFGMARALEELQNLADRGQLDFTDQLALRIDREASDRANAALLSRLRHARLRQAACFENLNMKPARGLDKSMIRDLFTCRWIGERRHLIVTGTSERLSLTINVRSPARAKAGLPAHWATRPPARAIVCCICACRGCLMILPSLGSATASAG